jgi:parallel beta-helix repeat protein
MRAAESMVVMIALAACSTGEATSVPEPSAAPPTAAPPSATPTTEPLVNATMTGTITRDEIWRGEIHLTGDITMTNGAVLTIEPGTVVLVAPNSDDQHCCPGDFDDEYTRTNNDPTRFEAWNMNTIQINGQGAVIRAIGTPEEPIVFRPEGDDTSPAQWEGVHLERGTIQYATLLYGGHTAIQVLRSATEEIEIAHNEVRFFLWAGIDSHSDDVWIHHNIVEGGGHQAIGVRGNTLAEHNIVIGGQSGIAVENGAGAVIRNNIVIDCARGMELRSGSDITVVNNTVARIDGPPDGWYYQGALIYPAFEYGGGIDSHLDTPEITMTNNILFGAFDWGIGLHKQPGPGSVVDYNLMWGQTEPYVGEGERAAGAHSLSQDPLFVDSGVGDFKLLDASPARDAGAPSLFDADGSPSDLGAYGGPKGQGW